MKIKWLSIILSVSLILLILPLNVAAAETYTYSISPSSSEQAIGSEFDVTIVLTNYATTTANIRGLQIDVTGIDTSILEVVSHSTSITDATAASNKTSYSTSGKYVRLMYANMSGTLDKSTTEVFKMRLKINSSLTSDGTITLPVTLKIVSTDGNTTQNSSIVINYTAKMINVDVTWGNMEFVYDDGTWDAENHKQVNAGWKPASTDGNLITIQNNSTTSLNAQLSYESKPSYSSLSGTFSDGSNNITSPFVIAGNGSQQKIWFSLSGETDERWTESYVTVGSITLTISE